MRKLFAIALCALLAAISAEATTYYADSARPNNNGNGRSAKTAKKTIQAAINAAKDGDTILVQPGKYGRIRTNNKRITIKSTGGKGKTVIVSGVDNGGDGLLTADLAAWSKNVTAFQPYWNSQWWTCCWKIQGHTATTLQGFTLRPTSENRSDGSLWYFHMAAAIAGGTAKNCTFELFEGTWRYYAFPSANVPGKLQCTAAWPTFLKTKLVDCVVSDCSAYHEMSKRNGVTETPTSSTLAEGATFVRSRITRCQGAEGGVYEHCKLRHSEFANCLIHGNYQPEFLSCTLGNCTVAANNVARLGGTKAYNTLFHRVPASQFKAAKKNTFVNCYNGSAPGFADLGNPREWLFGTDQYVSGDFIDWWTWRWDRGLKVWLQEVDPATGYRAADYHLTKGSPCLGKGSHKAAAKKLYGTRDLDGRNRIHGARIDIGCYEY